MKTCFVRCDYEDYSVQMNKYNEYKQHTNTLVALILFSTDS
jgi:hypothetical protein